MVCCVARGDPGCHPRSDHPRLVLPTFRPRVVLLPRCWTRVSLENSLSLNTEGLSGGPSLATGQPS